MSAWAPVSRWLRRTGSTSLGWLLVIIGVPLLPLPGPGTIVIVSGMALLARRYTWAQRLLGPLERKAVEAARFGVETWPRITVSALGGVWLVGLGVFWWVAPDIPEFELLGIGFGPELPAGGWVTGLGLMSSAVVAWGLLLYSIQKYRGVPVPVSEPQLETGVRTVDGVGPAR